jgi:hypothetical protein
MKNVKKKITIITSLVFLVVAGGSTGAYAYYKTPVSYLSLDINPSVELGVNAFDKVVEVTGYNADGEKILEGIDVEGSNVTEAVKTLITSATDNGYIEEDGSTVVSLTSETDNPELATEIQKDAEEGANLALEEKVNSATVQTDNVSLSMNEEARALGITPGKLNLIRKLQEVDPTATVDQYKDSSVKNIMKTIKNCREQSTVKSEEDVVNNQEESTVENKEKSAKENKVEGTIENKEGNKVENKKEGTASNNNDKIEENKNKSIEESNVNENKDDTEETKSIKKGEDNKISGNNNADNGNNAKNKK